MRNPRPLHVGLTGGIGSGKSTLAQMWAGMGIALVDADAISRQLAAPGGAAVSVIARQFGERFIGADGAMDRNAMRQHIIACPGAKQQLEALLHPLIQQTSAAQAALAQEHGHKVVVFDIPLLVESKHWARKLDLIVVVDCDEATQIARVIARNAWPLDTIHSILGTQASRSERLSQADIVVMNGSSCTLPQLQSQAQQIAGWFGL
jgi:dephospho-CoA kinase